mmetsp:Transcript_13289/g.24936  ORF Transcript_13289/g.24936 Transcript_13289/m.24936 type:complete len:126 (-) Transcript_13289:1050-1427(-)
MWTISMANVGTSEIITRLKALAKLGSTPDRLNLTLSLLALETSTAIGRVLPGAAMSSESAFFFRRLLCPRLSIGDYSPTNQALFIARRHCLTRKSDKPMTQRGDCTLDQQVSNAAAEVKSGMTQE